MRKLILTVVLVWPLGAGAAFYAGNQVLDPCVGTKPGEPNVTKYNMGVAPFAGLPDSAAMYSNWGHHDENGLWTKRLSSPTVQSSKEYVIRERRMAGVGIKAIAMDVGVGVSVVQRVLSAVGREG